MSDDDEMESFDINEEDINRAFNPGGKRNKMSKEQAMLGIWASNDSDDDDGDQFSYKNQKKKFPIGFVSGSKKAPNTSKKQNDYSDEDENENQQNYSDYDDYDEKFESKKSKKEASPEVIEFDSENENEESSVNNEFLLKKFSKKSNKRIFAQDVSSSLQNEAAQPKSSQSKPKQPQPELSKNAQKEIGNWEKHTKGFGLKMMMKMGWEKGKGIGKELQGRAIPVEAFVRKGKAAVGSYGPESKDILKQRKQAEEDEEDEAGEEDNHVSQWKKNKKNKKLKYNYRTPEELLQLAANNPQKLRKIEQMLDKNRQIDSEVSKIAEASKIKIIDMTGKEQRVMHGYESISQMTRLSKQLDDKKNMMFDLPELTHNLDILVSMTEDKILQSDKKFKHYEDMIVSLSYEEKRTREKLNIENEQIDKINELMQVIERCERLSTDKNITTDELIEAFANLQKSYPDEFLIFNLAQVVIPLLEPGLKRKMSEWDPFNNNSLDDENMPEQTDANQIFYCHDIYSDLKQLLNDRSHSSDVNKLNLSPYDRIVWDTWMPSFRKILAQNTIKKHSFECVDILNKWKSLLPNWILKNIQEQIILPKLISETEEWNPVTDEIQIHTWTHPWLPIMKERLDLEIFPTIRYKLSNALMNWHPSDESAKAILLPWRPPVFSAGSWDAFMCKNILPKLELVFANDLVISASNQNLEPWNWVNSWLELVPTASFISLMEKKFFPKWLEFLCKWLNSTNPNYEEVTKWYLSWKSLLNEKLIRHPNVQSKFSQALIMMNNSSEGMKVSYSYCEATQAPASSSRAEESVEAEVIKMKGMQSASNPAISSFKDIIQKKASEYNLVFMPIMNRIIEGKQVYRFGNLNIYLDKNVAFMMENGIFRPTSIKELLEKAIV